MSSNRKVKWSEAMTSAIEMFWIKIFDLFKTAEELTNIERELEAKLEALEKEVEEKRNKNDGEGFK